MRHVVPEALIDQIIRAIEQIVKDGGQRFIHQKCPGRSYSLSRSPRSWAAPLEAPGPEYSPLISNTSG